MVHHDEALGRLTDGEGRLGSSAPPNSSAFLSAQRRTDDDARRLVRPCRRTRHDAGGTQGPLRWRRAAGGRVAAVLRSYRGPVAPMSFDPGRSRRYAAIAASCHRHRRGKIPAASGRRADAGLDPPGHGLSPHRHRRARTIRGLRRRRFAGFGAYIGAACSSHAAIDVDGADRGRAATAARFADQIIFEGFRPLSPSAPNAATLNERIAHQRHRQDARSQRRGMGRLRQSAKDSRVSPAPYRARMKRAVSQTAMAPAGSQTSAGNGVQPIPVT